MIRRTLMGSAAAALALLAFAADAAADDAADWRDEVPVLRIGILGGENEADRLRRYDCVKDYLGERLGIPIELYPASDYSGVMQGLIAGNLDFAGLGSAGYAGIYLEDPDAVEPLLTTRQLDGSLGYYSVMYVRADSAYESLEDLEGASLAFADPNSTSGYLVPLSELRQQGIDAESYFSRTGFAGGHEQAVIAVLEGQYDAGVTWTSGLGEHAEGYTRGNFRRMVENDLLDMEDVRIIWQSNLITNGPRVVRKDVPDELKYLLVGTHVRMKVEDPDCFHNIMQEVDGFEPIDHEFYKPIIEMRREVLASRRG